MEYLRALDADFLMGLVYQLMDYAPLVVSSAPFLETINRFLRFFEFSWHVFLYFSAAKITRRVFKDHGTDIENCRRQQPRYGSMPWLLIMKGPKAHGAVCSKRLWLIEPILVQFLCNGSSLRVSLVELYLIGLSQAYFILARCLFLHSDWDAADRMIEECLQKNDTIADAYLLRAEVR